MKEHKTFLRPDRSVKLFHCTNKACNCGLIHCPFCNVDHFKPSTLAEVREHLELTHFAQSVVIHPGVQVVKCFLQCGEECGKLGHYHCVYCAMVVGERNGFIRHLRSHLKNVRGPKKVKPIVNEDVQLALCCKCPEKFLLIGKDDTEVSICKGECGEGDGSWHFHCPNCSKRASDRSQLITHWWKCQGHKDAGRVGEGFSHDESLPHPSEVKGMKWHASIVRSLLDIDTERCEKKNCCTGRYFHCTLCPELQICHYSRALVHYRSHWHKKVDFQGYSVLPCYQRCEVEMKNTVHVRCHYHCPICGETRRRRLAYLHHLKICKGNPHETHSYAIQRSKQLKTEEDLQFYLDGEMVGVVEEENSYLESNSCGEIEGGTGNLPGQGEEISVGKVCQSVEKEVTQEVVKVTGDCVQEKILDLKNLEIFEETTAKISRALVSAMGSEEMRNLLTQICGSSPLTFDTSPGISLEVFTLSGPVEDLVTAKNLINKIVEDNFESKRFEQAVSKITADSFSQKNKQNATAESPRRGRPKKKVKNLEVTPDNMVKTKVEEHGGSSRTGSAVKEGRRYGTRGVKLDFSALAHGKDTEVHVKTERMEEPSLQEDGERVVRKKDEDIVRKRTRKSQSDQAGFEEICFENVVISETPRRSTRERRKSRRLEDSIQEDQFDSDVKEGGISESVTENLFSENVNMLSDNKDRLNKDQYAENDSLDSEDAIEMTRTSVSSNGETTGEDNIRDNEDSEAIFFVPEIVLIKRKAHSGRKEDLEDSLSDEENMKNSEDTKNVSVSDQEENEMDNCDGESKTQRSPDSSVLRRSIPSKRRKVTGRNDSYNMKKKKKKKSTCHSCRHCNFVDASFASVTTHMLTCHPGVADVRCDICERSFNNDKDLGLHIQQKHGPLPQECSLNLSCLICKKEFCSARALASHTEKKHSGNSAGEGIDVKTSEFHVCEMCGKKFRIRSHLIVHKQAVHLNQKYTCEICNKTFNHIRYLQMHVKRHNPDRKYKCEKCSATFADFNSLKVHGNTHKPREEREYKFMCSYCGKKFINRAAFNEHVNKHTGDKPFQCKECSLSFAHRSTLKKHEIFIHSTERPYSCSHCHKAFKFERLLRKHLNSHTKEGRQLQRKKKPLLGDINQSDLDRRAQAHRSRKRQNTVLNSPERFAIIIPNVNNENTPGILSPDMNTIIIDSRDHTSNVVQSNCLIIDQTSQQQQKDSSLYVDYIEYTDHTNPPKDNIRDVSDDVSKTTNQVQISSHMMQVGGENETQPEIGQNVSHDEGNKEIYICSECGANFDDMPTAEHHLLTVHTTELEVEQINVVNFK